MECDQNMGLVNTRLTAETPDKWITIFRDARQSPTRFDVIPVHNTLFRSWTKHLDTMYAKFHLGS